ncbi:MAG: undecaprenyl-diphosphate phosphatase, partial [Oscillospiraceae bacterium]|nr:undecaprenyl-diphosphate phosphatase [Oscillospiraceae bacterium]
LLHLGTLISICLVYQQDLVDMFNDCITFFTISDAKLREKSRPGTRQTLMLLISTLPLVFIVPLYDAIEQLHSYTFFIGLILMLTGCLLYVSDQFLPGKKDGKTITILDALIIGVCQCVATIPGLSRSATTITACLCCGVDREYAVKYSFLLSLPAVLGANILSFIKLFSAGVQWQYVPAYLIGTAVALITGVLSIGVLQLIAKKGAFGMFRYYCWGAGLITIFLTAIL